MLFLKFKTLSLLTLPYVGNTGEKRKRIKSGYLLIGNTDSVKKRMLNVANFLHHHHQKNIRSVLENQEIQLESC